VSWDTLGDDNWDRWHPEPQPVIDPIVEETDNPIVGLLLAADGETPLVIMRERYTVPFGYQKGEGW
jgi:hypothetical protein